MRPTDLAALQRLNRDLDAVANGEAARGSFASTIQTLRTLDHAAGPRPTFSADLRRMLIANATAISTPSSRSAAARGSLRPVLRTLNPGRWWPATEFGLLCLIVALLATSLFSGPQRLSGLLGRTEPPPTASRFAPLLPGAIPEDVVWSYDAGPVSTVAEANGAVYAATDDGRLVALDGATGETRWRVEVPGGMIYAIDVVAGDRFYTVDTGKGIVYGFSADDEQRGQEPAGNQAVSSPVGDGQVVVLGILGVPAAGTPSASPDAAVVVLDAESGREEWRMEAVTGPVVVNEGILYASTGRADFSASDLESGEELWRFESYQLIVDAQLVADTILLTALGELIALDASSGEVRWRTLRDGRVASSVVLNGDLVATGIATGSLIESSVTIAGLDLASGSRQWQYEHQLAVRGDPSPAAAVVSVQLAHDAGTLYLAGGFDPTLTAVDVATQTELWFLELDGQVVEPPIIGEGHAYLVVEDTLQAVELPGGD